MAAQKTSKQTSMDFPPLEGATGWSGLGQDLVPTPEYLKESLIIAGSAGGAILLGSFVLPKIKVFADLSPLVKAGIVLGIAIVGSSFAFRFSPQVAVGILGGLGGLALATAVSGLVDIPVALGYLSDNDVDEDASAEEAASALERMLPEERMLEGAEVRRVEQPAFGETAVRVRRINDPSLAAALAAMAA